LPYNIIPRIKGTQNIITGISALLPTVDNPTEIMDIGYDYMEEEQLFVNVWIYSKSGFKITIDGTEYSNAQLVEYYQGLIKETFKDKASDLHDEELTSYRHINTSAIGFDENTQLYFGSVMIRVRYFNT
jgi:hypothetical protein